MPKQLTETEKRALRRTLDRAARTAGQSIVIMITAMEKIDDKSREFELKQALLQLRIAYSRARLKL